jgi:CheY-like chemotaxis protein
MQRTLDTSTGLRQLTQEVVEIRLWETYILQSRHNLNYLLTAYSLDHGPMPQRLPEAERVSYRFMLFDWERTIKPTLDEQSVPFEVTGKFKVDTSLPLRKKKVYVAEDDLDILFAMNTILEDAGYEVLLSHCGKPMMESKLPATDLFILDRLMPDTDGLDICQHLRSHKETKNIPVIMISASRNLGPKALAAGANDYLEKPFQMQDLLRIVSKHTDPGCTSYYYNSSGA